MSRIAVFLGLFFIVYCNTLYTGSAKDAETGTIIGSVLLMIGAVSWNFDKARSYNVKIINKLRTMLLDEGEERVDFQKRLNLEIPDKVMHAATLLTTQRLILHERYRAGFKKKFEPLVIYLKFDQIKEARRHGDGSLRFQHQGTKFVLRGATQKIEEAIVPTHAPASS